MSAIFNKAIHSKDTSLSVMDRTCLELEHPHHFHPQFQLNYIIKGKGTRLVGTSFQDYSSGDLVLFGPNLLHYWDYDREFLSQHGKGRSIIIHFEPEIQAHFFSKLPELQQVNAMLTFSSNGIKFCAEKLNPNVIKRLKQIVKARQNYRIIILIDVLYQLAKSEAWELINKEPQHIVEYDENNKLGRILNYLSTHFTKKITLDNLAAQYNMTPSSFSKFFKLRTGKNYVKVLRELRLGYACKLLLESDLNISQICYECGYNNLSNFYSHFDILYKMTPNDYRKQFKLATKTRRPKK